MRDALRARERILEDVRGVIRERRALEEAGREGEWVDPLGVLMRAVDENGDTWVLGEYSLPYRKAL